MTDAISRVRAALERLLSSLSPLTICGRPIASLDSKLAKAIIEGVLALAETASQAPIEDGEGWQTIESAPKDGKPVIVGWSDYVPETGMWDVGSEDWVKTVWHFGDNGHEPIPFDETPTHWRLLPPPPSTGEREHPVKEA